MTAPGTAHLSTCRPDTPLPATVQDAPYVLESFADGWGEEDPAVKLVRGLLGAAVLWAALQAVASTREGAHVCLHAVCTC